METAVIPGTYGTIRGKTLRFKGFHFCNLWLVNLPRIIGRIRHRLGALAPPPVPYPVLNSTEFIPAFTLANCHDCVSSRFPLLGLLGGVWGGVGYPPTYPFSSCHSRPLLARLKGMFWGVSRPPVSPPFSPLSRGGRTLLFLRSLLASGGRGFFLIHGERGYQLTNEFRFFRISGSQCQCMLRLQS